MTPYFLCIHVFKFQTFLSQKRPNFLSQWEQSKVLTIYFFVFKCAHEDSLWTEKNDVTGNWHSNSEYFFVHAFTDSFMLLQKKNDFFVNWLKFSRQIRFEVAIVSNDKRPLIDHMDARKYFRFYIMILIHLTFEYSQKTHLRVLIVKRRLTIFLCCLGN